MIRTLYLLVFTLFYHYSVFSQVITIAEARALPTGATVKVRGIVTNGPELGKIRYLQDGTAGIAAYPGSGSQPGFETAVALGDSIEVTGTTVNFQGLLEITPIMSYSVISSGNVVPSPQPIAVTDLSDDLESRLIQLPCVTFDDAGGNFNSSGTYFLSDFDGNVAEVYLRSGHPLLGTYIPQGPVQLTAIVSSFFGTQLLPRFESDFQAAPCFYFVENPKESELQTGGFKVEWSTNLSASATLRFGNTPNPVTEVQMSGTANDFSYTFSGLQPGTIYWVQVEATHNGEKIYSPITPIATRSLSTGEIKIYFNHPIDESAAGGLIPDGQSAVAAVNETIARINSAQQTIDVAMYNNNRDDLTDALKAAHNRGVRVRYVAADETENYALQPAPPFPVVYGNTIALMHNKFLVIDVDLTANAWVMGGSMNWTNTNIENDYNNTLFIQDQSLARAYEIEFEEMWGSETAQPNPLNQRFGSQKKNNTPHRFIIGGVPVESWFSPSDQVTRRITETIETADQEALFALLTFTKDEQANALVDVFNQDVSIRGLIENTGDVGSEFNYLVSQGIQVQRHVFPGTMHHKYCIVDANTSSEPVLVTGSHNWTFTAETENDENTLIIHDADITTLYKAEFEQRWLENITGVETPADQGIALYPNPATTEIFLNNQEAGVLRVLDVLGRLQFEQNADQPGSIQVSVQHLPAGTYFALFQTDHGFVRVPFQKM
ncbi:MAG: T9SS type A sorting domain-containing protein [Saprospiraceae bacterium]|nr:T9SS type A sorting domain-containing protein [Saprospiraceae bacterium]